jgi:sulfatase maturation enzyme AslB (radical SAM superfamily)
LDKLLEAIKIIEENKSIPEKRKRIVLNKFRTIITNGILIPQMVDKLKENNFEVQISIDGCKEAIDTNRVFPTGKGTYDKIMEAIECCAENEIKWSVHGVIDKETLPYLFETTKWFFEIYEKYKKEGLDYAVSHLKHNTFQVIFESDYQDSDVDILIDQFFKIADWVWNHKELTQKQKERFFDNFFFKTGGVCGAGAGLIALDTEFNILPCHRVAFTDERENYMLGNVFKPTEFKNFKLYNAYFKLSKRQRYMYSAVTQNHAYKNPTTLMWFMWCPSTNLQETGSPYFQPVKYNLMFTELNRAIKLLRLMYFGSTVPKTTPSERKRNKC